MPTTTRSGVLQTPAGVNEGESDENQVMTVGNDSDGPEGNSVDIPINPISNISTQEVADVAAEIDKDEFNISFQMFHSVMNSLRDTRTSIGELKQCMSDAHGGMATAREGMDEAKGGIGELTSVLRGQSERIDQLLEAMTHLSASVASNYINPINQTTGGSFPQINQVRSGHAASTAAVNVSHANSPSQVRLDGCQIPYFEASPTPDVMHRNQVLESWLRRIELHGQTDEDRIRLARCFCKNNAELVINSPQFDSILAWPHFKTLLRQKFRGTSCSNDFFTTLQRKSMRDDQTPQDFLLEVEGAVYLGARDYPLEMGEPTCLIRRVFLAGLPPYLSDFLVACDDLPLCDIAAKANKLYLARATRAPLREPRRPLPVAAAAAAGFRGQDPPVTKPYCAYHRDFGHATYECREKPRGQVCWRCARAGHFRLNCPFPAGRTGDGPRPSGSEFDGSSPGQ